MGISRLENIGIVVEDLAAVVDFFVDLGLSVDGRTQVRGDWVDRVVGLEDVRTDIVVLHTPDGQGRLELMRFHSPPAEPGDHHAPPNTLGLRRIAFGVDDVDATVAVAQRHGAELLGTIESYQDVYRLCYLRGPEGIIVMLAEELGGTENSGP